MGSAQQSIGDWTPRADALFREALQRVYRGRDRVFAWLMGVQWIFGIATALVYSPYSWAGRTRSIHVHVYYAAAVGGAISLVPIALTMLRSGSRLTRHTVAVAQMCWSALLIHVTGGRIETHFHVFGSLAFLAYYRDWEVLVTATLVVVADHLFRGLFWPESVYGIANPEWWRFFEHGFWVAFEDVVLFMGIAQNVNEMRALAVRQAETEALNASVECKVIQRTEELEASREQYRMLVETAQAVPWRWDPGTRQFTYVGPQALDLLGCPHDEWLDPGFLEGRIHPEDLDAMAGDWRNGGYDFEFRLRRAAGDWIWVRDIVSERDGDHACLTGLLLDITERKHMELELRQAQKLESVGRLASGVAHEINTPVQFVSDSVEFLRTAVEDLLPLLAGYRALRTASAEGRMTPELLAAAERAEEAADLDFLLENMPKAVDRSSEGLTRVADIVRAMKEFAHPDSKERSYADINRAILTTLTIARSEYKYIAEIETVFAELPPVLCHVSEINQVILNLIVNAAHAVEDVVRGTDAKGIIRVTTRRELDEVVVAVSDSGVGISPEVRPKIFEPFFTTKSVGKGTGQGLAIARNVVVVKHGGTITFETAVGEGTTFFVRLPIEGRAAAAPQPNAA